MPEQFVSVPVEDLHTLLEAVSDWLAMRKQARQEEQGVLTAVRVRATAKVEEAFERTHMLKVRAERGK